MPGLLDEIEPLKQAAVADLKAGTMHGENGIEAQGAFGHIKAQRFALNRETKQLRFSGNVQMLLNGGNIAATRRTPE